MVQFKSENLSVTNNVAFTNFWTNVQVFKRFTLIGDFFY